MKTFALSAALFALLLLQAPLCAAEEQAPPPRTVAVSGSGEVSVMPDRARLSLAVDALDLEVKKAETVVNRVVRDYLVEAKQLGAKAEQISTTGISIQPEYVWDEKLRQQKLVGYRVRRDIQILITDLDKLGDYVLSATAAGVNQVRAPVLESSRADELEREALAKAAKDAEAKAKVLATTLGARLGPARSVRAAQQMPAPVMYKAAAMRVEASFDSGNQEMGVSTGEIRVPAAVDVEFDLLP
ncbi:DUF541 domain-containing protein [Sinimarinibacterium sp. CAU 1509]|uniref:SIMPL domain-containing protein n=1 Tax=Sinimarinibacterium sp. CAU 1509 TaxID=2562283 RepID=UPI0010AC008E|nr:SIMPL domain-containing protein [Sinimarinibacterium sp. CAU 1509]TJY58235.1 DUF541 domain-containing protein [Sinimarinibacterium sp. CAU 1509]